jgi:hypothetical protein
MAIERIILGDDHLEFAKKAMPSIPRAEVEFVDDPDELVARIEACEGAYDLIISDLEYGEGKKSGLDVFAYLSERGIAEDARKILWTGCAGEPSVREAAQELGVELLDKDELGSLVGMAVSKAPLKTDGGVFVYVPDMKQLHYKAVKHVVDTVFDRDKITVGSGLKEALESGKYGLVIDASTLDTERAHGVVAHDMKYMQLPEVPKVVCARDSLTVLADVGKAALAFYRGREK